MNDLVLTVRNVWPGRYGGAVFTGADTTGTMHRIVADARVLHRPPIPGEQWSVAGKPQTHLRYGVQIHADQAVPIRPTGELIQRFLARNRAFQGVGEVKARNLWDRFRDSLYDLLDGEDVDTLAEILGDNLARSLVEAWKGFKAEVGVVRWLEQHGFPVGLAVKVMRLWGIDAPEKISENPYRMLAIASWAKVDAAALDAGAPPDCPERRIASVEAVLYRAMQDKHTVVPEGELLANVRRLLRCPPDVAREALRLAEQDHAVVRAGEVWQALGPHVMESFVTARIRDAVVAEEAPSGHLFWHRPDDARIQELIAAFHAQEGLKLTDEQQMAVWLAMTQRFALILGGAGTGKTSTLRAITFAQEQTGGMVHAVALAGRAAQRIREATGSQARTLAGFLGAIQRQELELGGADLIVVDEASMVDLPLAYSLLRQLPVNCRVLLVGDPYQLPPIGMGIFFSALAADCEVPKVELSLVHRQAAETGIPAVAARIRIGEVPELPAFSGLKPGVSFLSCRLDETQCVMIEALGELGGPGECQVLGPVKQGPAGISGFNAALHLLRSTGKNVWCGFAAHDPVIHLENDYERLVWNGTLGTVEEVLPNGLRILWDGHEKTITYQGEERQNLDLAYAISVHKAQGSQFKRVIVPMFTSRLLERTLVYTALTRGVEQVVLVGDLVAMNEAIAAPPAPHRRRTGLKVAR